MERSSLAQLGHQNISRISKKDPVQCERVYRPLNSPRRFDNVLWGTILKLPLRVLRSPNFLKLDSCRVADRQNGDAYVFRAPHWKSMY